MVIHLWSCPTQSQCKPLHFHGIVAFIAFAPHQRMTRTPEDFIHMISAMAVVNFTSHQAPLLQFGARFPWEVRDVVGPLKILKLPDLRWSCVWIQCWVPEAWPMPDFWSRAMYKWYVDLWYGQVAWAMFCIRYMEELNRLQKSHTWSYMSHTPNTSIIPEIRGFRTLLEPLFCWINSEISRVRVCFQRKQIMWHGYCVCTGHMWLVDDICYVGTWCISSILKVNSRSAVRGFASRLVQCVRQEAFSTGGDWICLKTEDAGYHDNDRVIRKIRW